ncbi:hypothetical protein [Kitasatospora sp. NBC_01539]|uniref:hypothetical protein n=1 Tax=Kitasatospora sp. NBC_01539 TaxID=2903577 RepID=UPI0038601193
MTAVPEEPSAPVEAAPPTLPSVPPAPSDPPAAPPVGDANGTGSTDDTGSTEQVPEDSVQAPAVRKPRTARLLVAALLLGPLLGGGIGYAVQAARPATPLPPLGVGPLHYPAEPLDAAAGAAAQGKPINIDGDLRKLLVDRPADAKALDLDGGTGWLTAGERAALFGDSEKEFKNLLRNHFRRDAVLDYQRGDLEYRIELMQFGEDDSSSASVEWSLDARSDNDAGGTIDGTSRGVYVTYKQPQHYNESTQQYYSARASAIRGNVLMQIKIFSPKPFDANEIKDLSKRQWERLK